MDVGLILQGLLSSAVDKYPVLVSALLVMGVLRAVNKPLFSLLRTFVISTPNKTDDKVLDEVEASKVYKTVVYVLDWVASVKGVEKK
jgi:hypothetical protein